MPQEKGFSDMTQSPQVRAFTRTHDADDRREIFVGDSVSIDDMEEDICVHAVVPASSLARGELDDTKSEMECFKEGAEGDEEDAPILGPPREESRHEGRRGGQETPETGESARGGGGGRQGTRVEPQRSSR